MRGTRENQLSDAIAVWMNELDQQAGGVLNGEIYFHGSQWESGGNSKGPTLQHTLPGYAIMDNFTDMLFDKSQYPNLNQVVCVVERHASPPLRSPSPSPMQDRGSFHGRTGGSPLCCAEEAKDLRRQHVLLGRQPWVRGLLTIAAVASD